MKIKTFISVGENIHCTRIYKIGGKFCKETADGTFAIHYQTPDGEKLLPIPETFTSSPNWASGKIKHCAVAIWQGVYGEDDGKASGIDYLQNLARKQEAAGATYLTPLALPFLASAYIIHKRNNRLAKEKRDAIHRNRH